MNHYTLRFIGQGLCVNVLKNLKIGVLEELLGPDAGGLSASSIASLKKIWIKELKEWAKRPITEKFAYLWVDGVNVSIRLGEDKSICLLVVMGVTISGEKKLLAVDGGYRESKENWKIIFNDLIDRGLEAPLLIAGDGALGMWAAIKEIEIFKDTKEQRCWFHKMGNVVNTLPKRLHDQAKNSMNEMMKSETRKDADRELKKFKLFFEDKYPKAVKCLEKDWKELTTFFDFPALHWQHIRTTNPIESAFATVKLRTKTTKGAGNTEMAKAMAFKLLYESESRWRKIRGFKELEILWAGGIYKDGKLIEDDSGQQDAVAF